MLTNVVGHVIGGYIRTPILVNRCVLSDPYIVRYDRSKHIYVRYYKHIGLSANRRTTSLSVCDLHSKPPSFRPNKFTIDEPSVGIRSEFFGSV